MHLSWHHLKFRNPQVIIVYDFFLKKKFIFLKYLLYSLLEHQNHIHTHTQYFCPSLLNFSIDSTID